MNPLFIFPPYFPKFHFHIFFLPKLRSCKWSLPYAFLNQNTVCVSHRFPACYIPRPFHPLWLNHPGNIWRSVQVTKTLITQSSPPPAIYFLLRRSILLGNPQLECSKKQGFAFGFWLPNLPRDISLSHHRLFTVTSILAEPAFTRFLTN
jgi:hypothetical protein